MGSDALLVADVARCKASHAALATWLEGLGEVDPAAPSALPGWTVGHVLTHLARNADSYRRLLDGHHQYASDPDTSDLDTSDLDASDLDTNGWEARGTAIDSGAGRPWHELCEDVVESSADLDRAFAQDRDWSQDAKMLSGGHEMRWLPLGRQREVEVHRMDLQLGHGLEHVSDDFINRDLQLLQAWWNLAQSSASAGQPARWPDAVVHATRRQRWAWFVGRWDGPDVRPAGLF